MKFLFIAFGLCCVLNVNAPDQVSRKKYTINRFLCLIPSVCAGLMTYYLLRAATFRHAINSIVRSGDRRDNIIFIKHVFFDTVNVENHINMEFHLEQGSFNAKHSLIGADTGNSNAFLLTKNTCFYTFYPITSLGRVVKPHLTRFACYAYMICSICVSHAVFYFLCKKFAASDEIEQELAAK
jgi:hypothetical protein